jgi:SAM-dependent methyltransferase
MRACSTWLFDKLLAPRDNKPSVSGTMHTIPESAGEAESSRSHFLQVTEIAGEPISQRQLELLCHRYYWASQYCANRDVLEVACGSAPGVNYLAEVSSSVTAGDYSPEVLARGLPHVNARVRMTVFNAEALPYPAGTFDVVLIFEALYYIPNADRFVAEARRVLRPGGMLLIANANKDLYDFNPSPFSFVYHGVAELRELLVNGGFEPRFYGNHRLDRASLRQRLLRPVKKVAVQFNLMPKTMAGKVWLKKLVFGEMVAMPDSIDAGMASFPKVDELPADRPDRAHAVIYCAAKRI